MQIEHRNHNGRKYYLHEGTTKKGNPSYWFSMSAEGNLAERIPDGYECYEDPNGMVYLRKKQPRIITDEEVQIVKNSIPDNLVAKLDIRKNTITVFLSDDGRSIHYQALMRFILIDEKTRKFEAQRYCFRGSIDDWIELDSSADLRKLAMKCCFHLGKDSFYDLPHMVDDFK